MTVLSFQILNTKVIFYAMSKLLGKTSGLLTFEEFDINIGGGFLVQSFTAPISGIYKMTFSGTIAFENDKTSIDVRKNGNVMFSFSNQAEDAYISYTWMMELDVGDRVNLWSTNALYATSDLPMTFTGELIHID